MATVPVGRGVPKIKMNTPAVNRLHLIGKLMDDLHGQLNQVYSLEEEFSEKRQFNETVDMVSKAQDSIKRVRDAIGKKGGQSVAKGYK
ncbi:hypothetical protein [Actinopolyspora saharensis]|uniref:Proteins of 100 residues with WXG n=1 Tax=Actinopolyspora saharensis TaxID=995062 RepID=A0A1H1G875_9ACTN|nr:hypothetical protein [Actinopolyspora saharensis]SDR09006.1 hypothetical protein SAMN04489718_3464 [Actinopolyspora saharensis]